MDRKDSGGGRKMKAKAIIPLILFIILSFFSLPFAVEKVQVKPGVVQTKPLQLAPVDLPDLVVDGIWLDGQCSINFRLKNSGPGNIPDGEHKESVVRVQFGSEIKDLLLGRIDPNGALKKAGGLISFNTQMTLKSSIDVKVVVDFNKKIKESDAGEKNNEKVAKLMPQCLPVAQMKADIKTKTSVGTTAEVQKSAAQKIPSVPIGIKADTAPINITILSPTQNSSWDIGSTLKIQWKVMAPTPIFHVLLKTPGMADTASTAAGEPNAALIAAYQKMQPDPQGFFNYDWQIPSYIKPGDYIVKIIYADDPKVFSKSGVFKINPEPMAVVVKGAITKLPSPVINVVNPAQDATWEWGKNYQIQWKSPPYGLGKLNIALFTEKGALAQQVGSGPDNGTYSWKVPSGIPNGKYFIRISTSDNKISGDSKVFNISDGLIVQVVTGGAFKLPAPVKITSFKLIGINPNYNRGILNSLEVEAQIDASSDFIFGPRTNDPKLGPISVQPSVSVFLVHVKPGSSIDFGTSKEALAKTFGYYDTELKITKWLSGGHYQVNFLINFMGSGVAYLCPIKVNGFIWYNGAERTCAINWEFHGRVTICLEGQSNVFWSDCKQIQFVNPGPPAQEIWVNGYPWDSNCTP
jgi:hypothetical protein